MSSEPLAERFSKFFVKKTRNITTEFDETPELVGSKPVFDSCMTIFDQFEPLSQNSVRKIIAASSSSTSRLDPIPTWILKMCVDELVPIVLIV